MAYVNDSGIDCCGICELASIMVQDPDLGGCNCSSCRDEYGNREEITQETYNDQAIASLDAAADGDFEGAFLFFSDNGELEDNYKSGRTIVQMIKKYKLGTVVSTRPRQNGNSGSILKAWLWSVDRKALQKKPWKATK